MFQPRSQVAILLNKARGRASRSERRASRSPRIKWGKREDGSPKVEEPESYITTPFGLHHRHPVISVICLSARRSRTPLSGVSHPRGPKEGTRARPGLLNQNAAEEEAREPAGRAGGSPDLAHTRASLPQRAALGSPGTATHRTFFHSLKWPSAWVTAQSTAVGAHPQGTWVLRGSDRAFRKRAGS